MQEKLETMNANDAYHKWGNKAEEKLRAMGKLIGLRLVGKLKPCDSFGLIKTKSKPILTVSDPFKKANEVGERLFVEITGQFPLTATRWYEATRNKLFWYGVYHFSGKMVTSFQHSKKKLVALVNETFKHFKGHKKYFKHIRMENAGENQAIASL